MLRLLFASLSAVAACMLVAGALTSSAQGPGTVTPDPFLAQVTHASAGGDSHASDTSGNGRFVVFESTADVATLKPGQTVANKSPNNTDGNREVFLYDYAQRRIFQLTNTRSVIKSGTPSPSPSPSPTASPSASPTPTPIDFTNVQIEVSNNRPMVSFEPITNTWTIVFSSNAPVTPALFDGTDPGAPTNTDMNQEIWIYQFTVSGPVTLSEGADTPFEDLSGGTFTRITNTPASRVPSAGSATAAPFVADDNRDAFITDDGGVIAFTSTRSLVAGGNTDANPEIFIFNRGTGIFTQATNTQTVTNLFPLFNDNPNIVGSGSSFTLAFTSNANLTANNDDGGGNGNAEIYLANYNGSVIVPGSLRQVTRTKNDTATQQSAVIFTFGRRLSRDGRWIAFESVTEDPSANGTNTPFLVSFIYDAVLNAFTRVGPRATLAPGDVFHFPTFTNYSGTAPGTVVFTSALNFKSDGSFPAADEDATGLNPERVSQIFLVTLTPGSTPVLSTGPFTRLTKITGTTVLAPLRALPSSSKERIAFSMGGAELGGGNADFSSEVFYQLTPNITTESSATISLFTGASRIPVAAGSSSPAPSPSPTDSPGLLVAPGLAPGELAIVTSSVSLAPATAATTNGSELQFAPPLPIELKGVSVAIQGAAAGLYSVSPTTISFVVPVGLATSGTASYPIVINNNGTVIRGLLVIVSAQPDVQTTTSGPNGRAVICNITIPAVSGCQMEPFNITTPDASGTPVATILEVHLTGVRGVPPASIAVVIGTTSITPSANITSDAPGFDQLIITLPSTVDRGDNLPVVVRVGTATSRPTPGDSPPLVKINP